ncbi:hypothetical protein, partial [Schaalia canis]|uniref:hypothetical protein n=1 Tax=Schaalia canis TaxID=100469 RepID=UPI00196B929F
QLSYTGQRATVHNLHIKNYNNYHVHTNTGTPVLVHNNGTDKCGDALAPLPDNPAGEIQQIAREEAAKGRQAWLNSLSPRQLAAIKESGAYWRAPMFIGTAIHETVAKRLEREFGRDVFKYNRVGPDFSYVDAAGNTKYVELTTPGQVASHKRRPDPRYASADYATYDMPQ